MYPYGTYMYITDVYFVVQCILTILLAAEKQVSEERVYIPVEFAWLVCQMFSAPHTTWQPCLEMASVLSGHKAAVLFGTYST